jgi:hypothetical protein
LAAGKVLIFVTQKTNSAELEKNLETDGFKGNLSAVYRNNSLYLKKFLIVASLLHGDMHQGNFKV